MDLYLSVKPDADDLAGLFEAKLPVSVLTDWSDSEAADIGSAHTIVLTQNSSEFPIGLSFQQQGCNHEQWLLDSGRRLSVRLDCRSLYTGNPVEPDNPFLCVIFEFGRAFLADDEGTELAEGNGKPVRIIRRLPELDAG